MELVAIAYGSLEEFVPDQLSTLPELRAREIQAAAKVKRTAERNKTA